MSHAERRKEIMLQLENLEEMHKAISMEVTRAAMNHHYSNSYVSEKIDRMRDYLDQIEETNDNMDD